MLKRAKEKTNPNVTSYEVNVREKGEMTQASVGPDEKAVKRARNLLKPGVGAVGTIANYDSRSEAVDLHTMLDELNKEIAAVQSNDFSRPEALLTAHAHALDRIFHSLAQRAAANAGINVVAFETYLRMALKAQAQCRNALEALSEIRHPKATTFIRQTNVAHQQQVNNQCTDQKGSREKKIT